MIIKKTFMIISISFKSKAGLSLFFICRPNGGNENPWRKIK